MTIIFKDVGVGDSIIIEWKVDDQKRLGIIDCRKRDDANPVLLHLMESDVKRIDFLLMSHPHVDHFDGIRELLEYCQDAGIRIERFLHTADKVPDYIRTAVSSAEAEQELAKLFLKIHELYKEDRSGIIVDYCAVNETYSQALNDEYTLRILAPTSTEHARFLKTAYHTTLPKSLDVKNNPAANWLSTVVEIYSSTKSILLTSDVERDVLQKLVNLRKDKTYKNVGNLVLGQIPHHGSQKNHNAQFWSAWNNREIACSAGNRYGHPAHGVVQYFLNNGHQVRITSGNPLSTALETAKAAESRADLELLGTFVLNPPNDLVYHI